MGGRKNKKGWYEKMAVSISFRFYTDDDFSLLNPEEFDCCTNVIVDGDFFHYASEKMFQDKQNAINFLEKLLCDIHVSSSHHELLKTLYDNITSLIDFIRENDENERTICLYGNYEPSYINVRVLKESIKDKTATVALEELKNVLIQRINDAVQIKDEYASACVDAWTEVMDTIDEMLHPEMYN